MAETLKGPRRRVARWYFGGIASATAACFTHPMDLLKVHLQTQQGANRIGLLTMCMKVVKTDGPCALWNGISASLLRRMTYSLVRFGVYEEAKQALTGPDGKLPGLGTRMAIASVAGGLGGFVGVPGDVVNVRMENDIKLPPERRRNYKNAMDGLLRVTISRTIPTSCLGVDLQPCIQFYWLMGVTRQIHREEGFKALFSGASVTTGRAVLMTVGQIGSYDELKMLLMKTEYFGDKTVTHIVASALAGAVATTITQPLDVVKTRLMTAKPGEFKGIIDIVVYTAKDGPSAFFKGYVPAFIRIGPHTILMFVFFEKLRENFGKVVE